MNKFDSQAGWRRVVARAERQYGVVTTGQLCALGVSSAAIHNYAAAGRLHPVHHGVYAIAPPRLLIERARAMAAVLALGPGAALSHTTAAARHGLLPATPSGRSIELTVPTQNGRSRAGLIIHRSRTLRAHDITNSTGIPTTTVARTLVDLAERQPPHRLKRAIDRAVTLAHFDLTATEEQLRHNRGRSRAVANLRAALSDYLPAAAPTWNEFEEGFLALIHAGGLPPPEVQPYLDLRDGEPMIQPDFLWREQRLIVELDGWRYHGGRGDFERDRRRDQRATAAGYRTLRFTWAQLADEPERAIATLSAASGVSVAFAA